MKSFSTSCSCLCPWCWNTFCFVSHIINYPWVENWFFTWSGHFCCFQAGTVSIFIFAEIKTSVFLFVDTHSCFNGSVFLHVLGKMKKWRQLVEQRKKQRERERESPACIVLTLNIPPFLAHVVPSFLPAAPPFTSSPRLMKDLILMSLQLHSNFLWERSCGFSQQGGHM